MYGKPIRGYSKYCADRFGNVFYTNGPKTRKNPEFINGSDKFILRSDIEGKRSILTPEQCVCLTFFPHYEFGDIILFKDGNSSNVNLANLNVKKARVVELFNSLDDKKNIKAWGIKSKCRSANYRTSLGSILTSEVYTILQISQFKCFYCQENLNCNDWHLDHFLPICQGGTNQFKNIRPSCPTCNMMKGRMTISQFRKKIDQLYFSLKDIGDSNNG